MERIPDETVVAGHTGDAMDAAQTVANDGSCIDCPIRREAAETNGEAGYAHKKHHLGARNLLALIAAVFFTASLLTDEAHLLLKAIAYGLGALAYISELLVITGAFKKKPPLDELFMPILFGGMYIVLGLSYALEHHYFG